MKTNERIKLDYISPGQQFENYKILCSFLGISPNLRGKSRQLQIKRVKKYIDYEKDGQSIFITGVNEKPLAFSEPVIIESENPRTLYFKYIQLILMQTLTKDKYDGKLNVTNIGLFKLLGLVNNHYGSKNFEKGLFIQHPELKNMNYEYNYAKYKLQQKLIQITECALDSLEKQGIINIIDLFFDLNSQILLLEFTSEPFQPGGLIGPVGKHIVFQKLLGNGTGTLGESSGSDIFYESTEDTSYVDSVVLVKTFILNGNYRMLQIHRNLFDGNRQTVGAWRSQLTQLVSVSVIQKGCISQRRNIHVICIRGIIYDSPKGPDAQTAYNHTERDQRYEQNSDKRNVCTFSHHGCTGNQRISLF